MLWTLLVAASLLMLVARLVQLGLVVALLLGTFVEGGDEVLERPDKMGAEVSLGFVCLFDGLGDILDRCGQALKGRVDSLEAGGDAAEELHLLVLVGSAHCLW